MSWVLFWRDAAGFKPGMPGGRPWGYGSTPMRAPWVEMPANEIRAAIADTDVAWAAYEASLPPAPPAVIGTELISPNGSVFQIVVNDAGDLDTRPVT